jgi:hypothetical protein
MAFPSAFHALSPMISLTVVNSKDYKTEYLEAIPPTVLYLSGKSILLET